MLRSAFLMTIVLAVAAGRSAADSSGCPVVPTTSAPAAAATDSVQLERSLCFVSCPEYRLRLYGDGRVEWNGGRSVEVQGQQRATVDAEQARTLIDRFSAAGFWSLCADYTRGVTDNPTYLTTLSVGGREKRVSDYALTAPQWLRDLASELDALVDTHRWRHGDPRLERFLGYLEVDARDPKPGVTPLMKASGHTGELCKVRKLLGAGAPVNAGDSSGWTALMYAMPGASAEVAKELLSAGASPNARSLAGETAIMAAATGWEDTVEKIRLLGAAGADLNAQDTTGETALMRAARSYWRLDVIRGLIEAGARTDVRDAQRRTAADLLETAYAERKGDSPAEFREALALLKRRG